jgi:uncharacterized protein
MNIQRTFDNLQKEKLGKYIYALRDPRDNKIFYVGQATNNDRVFDHFAEAENCLNSNKSFNQLSSKVIRILDIWKNNEDVQWLILAHNLPHENNVADYVESAIVDGLSESQNGETLNEVNPPRSSRLIADDLDAMAASFINPTTPHLNVFIFPIQNALNNGVNPYNATRTTWAVSNNNQLLKPSFAVGLKHSISKGSYEISSWANVIGTNKQEFTTAGHPNPEEYVSLLNKNWNNVLAKAKGFWQRGNYLIVEFDGQGHFRIIRGSQDTKTWHSCV